MNGWGAQDMQRRLANLIRVATITELDDAAARARVTCASVPDSAFLPILAQRAGPDRSYWVPEPGEQVLVLSPSGDPAQGMILPSGFQNAHAPPAGHRTLRRTVYADGTVVEYDREAHVLTVDCVGDIVVRAAGDLTAEIDGNVQASVQGTVSATVQGAVSLTTPTSVTIEAPITTVKGKLTVEGLLTYAAGLSGSGGTGATAKIDGNVKISGTTDVDGDVIAGDISLKHHKHPGDSSGTTGEPQ